MAYIYKMIRSLYVVLIILSSVVFGNAQTNKVDSVVKEYKRLITIADSIFSNYSDGLYSGNKHEHELKYKHLDNARNYYRQAINLGYDNLYAEMQIREIETSMKNNAEIWAIASYYKLIRVADNNFTLKEYHKATELYQRAVRLRPADKYPKNKLIEIEKELSKHEK